MAKPYSVRAARGAAWLDTHKPGWAERIDDRMLDMHDCDYCIVGQLNFGGYMGFRGKHTLEFVTQHGFEVADPFGSRSSTKMEYTQLRNAWLDEINKRRSTHA